MKFIFLALEGDPLIRYNQVGPVIRDTLIVIGAVVLVAVAVLLWTLATRSKPRRHSSHHHHRHDSAGRSTAESVGEIKRVLHIRHRRRRRPHRPRNPTLAQTGGLPPVRRDPPSAPSGPPIQT